MIRATINHKGAKRVRGGHLWVYKSDVLKVNAAGGDTVAVFDEAQNFVGKAFYSDRSEITLRFVTTKDIPTGRDFWRDKLRSAWARRENYRAGTNSFRVVSSEGDLMPSIIIDCYDGCFVIQTLSQGSDTIKDLICEILIEEFSPRAIVERNDVRVRDLEGLPQTKQLIYGEIPEGLQIDHDGIRFGVSLLEGQKTGSFLDQRENHLAARHYAAGKGLDCFTFNGGFALNLAGSCESVLALDISDEAISRANENAALNGITNVTFKVANVFDRLRELEKAGEKFDTIVLDPPAFVKNRAAIRSAVGGYKEINLRAMRLLNPGGTLITCSCSYHMTEELFAKTLEEAVRDSKKHFQLTEKRTQSQDHPILIGVPESYYLKCFILRALD